MTLIGQHVGKICIVKKLGEGGMGEVYQGYDETLERRVAVKVIRSERRLSQEAKTRFVREAKAMSKFEHRHICRVYDYVEEDEYDFLILEFIEGKTLPKAMERGLAVSEKLRIAEEIAHVLFAAHGKNIIHRDLKPDNVMLADNGTVKVLDFGLARGFEETEEMEAEIDAGSPLDLTEEELSDFPTKDLKLPTGLSTRGYHTEHGRILGTPMFMSPEQALAKGITSAADMFSYGLLLQWLFTEKYPYPKELSGMGLTIRAMKGDTLPVENLDADLTLLINQLKDIQIENRPSAREALDRIRWIREKPRRRIKRLVSAAFLALLILGTVLSTFGFYRAKQEEKRALENENLARQEAENATQFADLLLEFLTSVDPGEKGKDLKVMDLLEGFTPRLEALTQKPQIQAMLFYAYAKTYENLGLYDEAYVFASSSLEMKEKVFGIDHFETAGSVEMLGTLHFLNGELESARKAHERALEIRRTALGEAHPDTASSLNNLGTVLQALGDLKGARTHLEKAVAVNRQVAGDVHMETASSLNNLGHLLQSMGENEAALDCFKESLRIKEENLDDDHPSIAVTLNNIGYLLKKAGQFEEARSHFSRSLFIRKKVLGEDHPDMIAIYSNMGSLHKAMGDLDESRRYFQHALDLTTELFGETHLKTAIGFNNMGALHNAEGDIEGARPLYEKALAISRKVVGDEHTMTAALLNNLGAVLAATGEFENARDNHDNALAIFEKKLGPEHPSTINTKYYYLADLLRVQSKHKDAFALFLQGAKAGDSQCQFEVAKLHELGEGVDKNLDEAVRFYRLSSDQGHQKARKALKRLGVSER